jgi:hypothetical protein
MAPNPERASGVPHAVRQLPWMLALLVAVHAVVLASRIANPLVYSDNWTFIETFLKVALEDGAGFGDFLVKRAGVDHAQPLGKLLMLVNARWFGLDFALESFVGLACAFASWCLLCRVALSEARTAAGGHALRVLLLAALLAVQVAPTSVDVYAYPMVTMAHAFYLCAFVVLLTGWQAYQGGRRWPLAVAAAVCGIVGDDSAILLGAAAVPAVLLAGYRDDRVRAAWRVAVVLLVVLLACRGVYAAFGEIRGTTHADFNVGLGARVAGLASQWRESWQWLATPLSGGLASAPVLRGVVGEHWPLARIGVALLLLVGHGWFWWRALRAPTGATWFLAVASMLLFYAMVAGVLYGRVFVRGAGFLDQGRYAVFYQLGVAALLLMLLAGGGPRAPRMRLAGWATATLLLLLQWPLAMHAWQSVPYHRAAHVGMARDMAAMARDPLHPPVPCAVGVDICVRPEATRVALMAMLVEHRLNLFSPAFRARHPELAAAGPLPLRSAGD